MQIKALPAVVMHGLQKKSNIFNDYFSHGTKLISHGQEMNEKGKIFSAILL